MTTKSNTLFKKLAATFVLAATTAALYAADVTGTWTWSTPGRNGGPDRVSTLTLKADGANLTGKVSVPGRDGAATDTQIADGKVDGDKISFVTVREYNGRSSTNTYSGTVTADKITGKIGSVRNGEAQSRDWEAKRVTEAAKTNQ
jgi:hypothetical protein